VKPLILLFAASFTQAAWQPTQADLDADLRIAEQAWGMHADVASISWRALSDCKGLKGIVCAGWSELDTRKIYIQAAMKWTPQLLLIAVEHEYGHMLMGSAHSLDPNSVMFSIVHEGQRILDDDRMWAGKLAERPTILRKD